MNERTNSRNYPVDVMRANFVMETSLGQRPRTGPKFWLVFIFCYFLSRLGFDCFAFFVVKFDRNQLALIPDTTPTSPTLVSPTSVAKFGVQKRQKCNNQRTLCGKNTDQITQHIRTTMQYTDS